MPPPVAELPLAEFPILFADHPLPMWVYDVETLRFLEVNRAAVVSYGYARDEFLAMQITDIRPPEDVPRLLQFFGRREDAWFRAGGWRHRRKSGQIIDVEITSHPVTFQGRRAMLICAQDVTERRRLEAQLRHAQKMDALGRLAGGIIHDFNNVLTAILGYSGLLLEDSSDERTRRTRLEQVHKAAERARSLTMRLLAFSRKQAVEPRVLDLNALVEDAGAMFERLVGADIETAVHLGERCHVRADPGELVQVLTNLIVNARDALAEGGRLTIETGSVALDEAYARRFIDVTPGRYALLAVSDDGCGMPPEIQDRLFEPFFTTKPSGKGTGLGLSTVYGIVRQRGGHIQVYSEPGRGTTFRIYLPRVVEPSVEPLAPAPPRPAPLGAATVLVAEDDDEVRAFVGEALEMRGYHVLTAAAADEARRLLVEHRGPVHLLLTDLNMPGESGQRLAETLLRTRPELRVLYMSGFSDDALARTGPAHREVAFLQKPFTIAELERRVHELVAGAPVS